MAINYDQRVASIYRPTSISDADGNATNYSTDQVKQAFDYIKTRPSLSGYYTGQSQVNDNILRSFGINYNGGGQYFDGSGNSYDVNTSDAFLKNNQGKYNPGKENYLADFSDTQNGGIQISNVGGGKFGAGDGSIHNYDDIGSYLQTSYDSAPNYVQKAQYGNALEAFNKNDYYGNQFTNREIYDSLYERNSSRLNDYLGIDQETTGQLNSILYGYDPNFDYRTGFLPYGTEGTRDVSTDPQKQAALDYIAEARGFKNTARRKSFQGATLAGILAFAGGAAGLAAGAGGTAAAGAGGTAAGTGGGTAVGGAGGAVAGGAPAASGGLFVGSGGFLGGTGSALADAALNSAIQSAITSGISGGNPLKGALTGGLTGGLGSALGGVDFGLGTSGNSALAAALKGGLSSGISGGNPLIGGALGGLGSIGSSLFNSGTSGFQFGDQNSGTEPVSFGGADGGSNGFRLPEGYSNEDLDYFNNFQFPSSGGGGGNVSDFDFSSLFDTDSNSQGLLDIFAGQNQSIDPNSSGLSGLFDSLQSGNNSSFDYSSLLDLFGDGSNISSGLSQQDLLNEQNSGFTPQELSEIENFKAAGGTDFSKLGQNLLSKIAGLFSGAGGAGGGLAGLLSGKGGNFGQTLGNLTSGILTNSQKKAIEGARDTSVDLADPFRKQRGQYQTQLSNLLANPGSISSSPAFQGIYDLGLEAVNRNASAKGQLNSGNRLAALSDYGQKTASQYYFPQAQLLSNLAGVNAGSPATAAGINLAGTESAQGLRSKQAADFVGGLTGYQGNSQNDVLQRALLGLFGDKGI